MARARSAVSAAPGGRPDGTAAVGRAPASEPKDLQRRPRRPPHSFARACLLLAAGGASGAIRHAAAANATRPLWLFGTLPFTGGIWDTGVSLRHGGAIMLEEINKNPDLLPGYELKVVWQDDRCDARVAAMRILENIFDRKYTAFAPGVPLYELDANRNGLVETEDVESVAQEWNDSVVTPGPVGFIGACCSGVSLDVNNILYKARYSMISPTATRPILSDRSLYPNFFRSQMPDTAYSHPWIAIAKLLKQRSIVVVIAEATDWHSGGTDLARVAAEQGVALAGPDLDHEVPGFHGLQITLDSATAARGIAQELLNLKRRIVIFLTYAPRARLVMCEAYRLDFLNAIYMPMGWLEPGWWAKSDTACTVGQLTQMATGQIVVSIVAFRTDDDVGLSCARSMTSGEFRNQLDRRQVNASRDGYTVVVEPAFVADSICMFALALHEVLFQRGIPLAELTARTPNAYAAVQTALSNADFQGVSGHMRYEPGKADPQASVIVRQVQTEGIVDIATYTHPKFFFLGKANLTFQFPGESWFAGPEGAEMFEAGLTPFVTCPKGKSPNLGSNTCEDCPEHMEFVQAAEACLCIEGYFAPSSGGCLPCAGGSFSNAAGTLECTMCQAGKYSTSGSTSCELCPRGSFAATVGSSACTRCPPLQTTQEIGAANIEMCVCDRGSYRAGSSVNGAVCKACPANANTSGIAAADVSACNCRKDMYMSAFGSCVPCPLNSKTEEGGKTSVISCLCPQGQYMPRGAPGCRPCPPAMNCEKGSNEANYLHLDLDARDEEQQFPLLRPRFWSSAEDPMSVFDCRDEKKCPGGVPGRRACAPKMDKDNSVACQHCQPAHHWDGNACVECKGLRILGYTLFALFLVLAPVVIVGLYKTSGDRVNEWGTRGNAVAGLGFLTLNHYQMIDLMSSGALIPVDFRGAFSTISWTNDWYRIFQPDCTGVADLTTATVLKAISPIVALVICLLTYVTSVLLAHLMQRPYLQMQQNRLFNVFGSLCFTFFGAISLMSMSLFKCSENPNGLYTLTWELSVTCFSSNQWRSLLGIGMFCVLVYIIGLGSLFLRIVIIAPRRFQEREFQVRWKFLFIKFHSGAYWWGVVHLAKNALIQLAFVVFSSGWRRLYSSLAGLLIYTGIAMVVMPFRTIVVNVVEVISGGSVIYMTAMLVWFADRADERSNDIIITIVSMLSLPLLLAMGGMGVLAYCGKRAQATAAQIQRAEKDFQEICECSKALANMDVHVGGELVLWLGDWERWACLHSAKLLRSDLLGISSGTRIAHFDVPKKVKTCVWKSTSTYRNSVGMSLAEREAAEAERDYEELFKDFATASNSSESLGHASEWAHGGFANEQSGMPASTKDSAAPKFEPPKAAAVSVPDEECIEELGSFLSLH